MAKLLICIILSFVINYSQTLFRKQDSDIINISDYDYPHPQTEDSVRETIALFGTNDYHGYAFPVEYMDEMTKEKYLKGGVEYMATLVDIVRNEWKEKFIWLDAGDQFSGGFEFKLTNGKIMNDFFNYKNITACTLGNHDYNFGIDFLKNHMNNSYYDYLVANIRNKTDKTHTFLPKQYRSKLYHVGKVKLGVIGLTHNKVAGGNIKIVGGIEFLQYKDIIIEQSSELKTQGADAVILLSHFGPKCGNEKGFEDKFKLKMRNSNIIQPKCTNLDGIMQLIQDLPSGTIHAIVAGHAHAITHHWIHDIPIMSSTGPDYANVLYLHFNKYNRKLIFDEAEIEGPIPVCSKIYSKAKHCSNIDKEDYDANKLGSLKRYSFHNVLMQPDFKLGNILQPYKDLISPYKEKICYNEVLLKVNNVNENTVQNVVTDAMKKKAKADISVFYVEGLRTKWYRGDLTYIDMYNMFPFDNIVCSFEMTGGEIIRMLSEIVNNVKFYMTSGLMVTYGRNPNRFIEAKLFDGKHYSDIELNKTYTVSSLDYLIGGNIDFARVVQWYELKKYRCYSTIRDVVRDYLKELKILKKDAFVDPNHPRMKFIS